MREIRLGCRAGLNSLKGHMNFFPSLRDAKIVGVISLLFWLTGPVVLAQEPTTELSSSSVAADLPEAPSPNIAGASNPTQPGASAPVAEITAKFIPSGWRAQELTRRDKVNLGVRDLYTPESIIGYILPAGYSHLTNGQPNFGTNSGAFAQRLGATFARDVSQGVFKDVVLAPLLHEDPRYYVEGSSHGVVHRTLYAMTRPLITRNDQGGATINGSLLLGYAGAAALTGAYYPVSNRNLHDIASTYGGSIGGAALGCVFQEFTADFLAMMHVRHKQMH